MENNTYKMLYLCDIMISVTTHTPQYTIIEIYIITIFYLNVCLPNSINSLTKLISINDSEDIVICMKNENC